MANSKEINSSPPLSLAVSTVRKSGRQSIPNSCVLSRRQLISNTFNKVSTPPKAKRKTGPVERKKKTTKVQKQLIAEKEIKDCLDDVKILQNSVIRCDSLETNQKPAVLIEKEAQLQKDVALLEKDVNLLEIAANFVVTKNAGVASVLDRDIHPTYFPSEAENSGIIVFKSHSRRAVLNISFSKCFVILNGSFSIDKQGVFNIGDFIKAPAGSKLGIKYLGGNNEFGKIIFFKSVT